MPSYKPVTAALRTLDILTLVNSLAQPTFAAIHRASKLSSATVVRVLETLEHAGMIIKDTDRGVYLVTSKTLSLSSGYDPQRSIAAVAAPILAELQRRVGWPSDFAIFEADCMIVISTSRGQGRLFFDRSPGFRAPLLGTSLGIAFLSSCDETQQTQLLKKLSKDPAPWNDIARDTNAARTMLKRTKRKGYAVMHPSYSKQSYDSTISAVGVPVIVDDTPVAALNITFSVEAVETKDVTDRFLPALNGASRKIASLWPRTTDGVKAAVEE